MGRNGAQIREVIHLDVMRIAPTPDFLASSWTFLLRHLRQLLFTHRRPHVRIIQASPMHFDALQNRLREHGIATEVRSNVLVAHLRSECEQSDLFLIEFSEFMVNAPVAMQGQWLEFCLELHP